MISMLETREQRERVLTAAVKAFLDHLDEDFGDDDPQLGAVVIAGEITIETDGDETATIPSYWASNENGIWQRGFFELLAEYKSLNRANID